MITREEVGQYSAAGYWLGATITCGAAIAHFGIGWGLIGFGVSLMWFSVERARNAVLS